jgi:hypothetical protein
MNKKQSIIGWAMILSIAIVIARTIIAIPESGLPGIMKLYSSFVIIIIIGGLLVYISRDKKAKPQA